MSEFSNATKVTPSPSTGNGRWLFAAIMLLLIALVVAITNKPYQGYEAATHNAETVEDWHGNSGRIRP